MAPHSLLADLLPDALRAKLRALAIAAGVSPSALASHAGKAPSVINKFLAGETANPEAETLAALERAALDLLCGANLTAGTPRLLLPVGLTGDDVAALTQIAIQVAFGRAGPAPIDFPDSFDDVTDAGFRAQKAMAEGAMAKARAASLKIGGLIVRALSQIDGDERAAKLANPT